MVLHTLIYIGLIFLFILLYAILDKNSNPELIKLIVPTLIFIPIPLIISYALESEIIKDMMDYYFFKKPKLLLFAGFTTLISATIASFWGLKKIKDYEEYHKKKK